MSIPIPTLLKVAFCLCDDVTLSDFVTPSEILGGINLLDGPLVPPSLGPVPYRVTFDFLAPEVGAVKSLNGNIGLSVNATKSYAEAQKEQYDILWVPAGPVDMVKMEFPTPQAELDFIKTQAPKAKYVMSVCGGSQILGAAGVLSGKKATTNKALYKAIVESTENDIQWVPQARWVVDGNVWTSSGVTAGADMALAFVSHLVGEDVSKFIRGIVEVIEHKQDDDPFAAFHGLV